MTNQGWKESLLSEFGQLREDVGHLKSDMQTTMRDVAEIKRKAETSSEIFSSRMFQIKMVAISAVLASLISMGMNKLFKTDDQTRPGPSAKAIR